MRALAAVLLLLAGAAQACLFEASARPQGWLEWSSGLFAGEVTRVEKDAQKPIDVVIVRGMETFKGPDVANGTLTVQIPSRYWASCKLEVPAAGARVLVAVNAKGEALIIPLTESFAAALKAKTGGDRIAAEGAPKSRPLNLDGPAVHVQVDAASLCVGRRFIEPGDLERWNAGKKPVTSADRRAVPLALFSQALTGYTDAQYREAIAAEVRIEILPAASRRPRAAAPFDFLDDFSLDWAADSDFRAHKRRPDCVGKKVAAGPLSAVATGAECRDTEMLYGHRATPDVVLYCNPRRCYTANDLEVRDVNFEYDFPREFLAGWPGFHSRVVKRVSDWRADNSCLK